MNKPFSKTIFRCSALILAGFSGVSCNQQDPAIVNELIVLTAEKDRLKGELEKVREANQALQQKISAAESNAEKAVSQAKKGLDKKMVQRSFVEAVYELQSEVQKKFPQEVVDSYKIFDVNFPSENPISSSVSFSMKDGQGNERQLSFEGAANNEGVWNFAPVENVVARTPKVKAPEEKPQETAPSTPAPTQPGGIQRIQPPQQPASNARVHVIEWPE